MSSKVADRRTQAGRDAYAIELRTRGYSISQVATAMGYESTSAASVAVRRGMESICREPAEDYLILERDRFERMFQGLVKHGGLFKGDPQSVMAACKIIELRAKLEGRIKPASVNLAEGAVVVQVSNEDLLSRIARIAAAASATEDDRKLDA